MLKPLQPEKDEKRYAEYDAAVAKHNADIEARESRTMVACRILRSVIARRLITHVVDEDDLVKIWQILKDKLRRMTDIALAQSLNILSANVTCRHI
jgi:hypothetical protein